jgi:hypothetical protein
VPGSEGGALASGDEGVIAQPASASVRAVAAATRCAAFVNAVIDSLHEKQRRAQRELR